MKIAYFTETYLPNTDGVVTSILSFRKELEERGHEVYIFCSGSRKAKKENRDSKVFYHLSTPFRPYPDYKIAIFPFYSIEMARRLEIDLLHTHGMATMGLSAASASFFLGLPLVGTFHTFLSEAVHLIADRKATRKFAQQRAWKYLRWYYRKCDVIIAPTDTTRKILVEHGFKDVKVIPSGVDIERFRPDLDGSAVRRELGLENAQIVLHVGRVSKEKNLEVLIAAAPIILGEAPEVRFVIVGGGPAEQFYREQVRKQGLQNYFKFTGRVEDEKLPLCYAASDALVFPSKFETQGLVSLEAMASGKPVAGANYLAIGEIVKDGYNGFLFNPDDPLACANAVMSALAKRKALAENCLETAEAYSVKRCTDKLVALYKEVLA